MRIYEKKKFIYVLSPKEQEKGIKLIIDDLVINKNVWQDYNIEEPTLDKYGNSVYLVHVWM